MRALRLTGLALVIVVGVLAAAFVLFDRRGNDPAPLVHGGHAPAWLPSGVGDDVVERLAHRFSPVYVPHPGERHPAVAVRSASARGVRVAAGPLVSYWLAGGPRTGDRRADYAFTIQYWTYHAYNSYDQPGPDFNHAGDWERVALEFDAERVRLLGAKATPARIFLGHHNIAEEQAFLWGDQSAIARSGVTHPVMWVALGSHGLWSKCGRLKRQAKLLGVVPTYDTLAPCGARKQPLTPVLRPMPRDGWACFRGRWGKDTGRITGTSPYGPRFQQAPFGGRAAC